MTNRLPEQLSALRKHFSYSQGDVAEKLQVPVTEYMNWENGNTICRIDQLKMLAKLFKTPIEDLADNTRTVTLPRLDEDDDSVQIAFGMNSPIDREVLNNSVEETEDVVRIHASEIYTLPVKTYVLRSDGEPYLLEIPLRITASGEMADFAEKLLSLAEEVNMIHL